MYEEGPTEDEERGTQTLNWIVEEDSVSQGSQAFVAGSTVAKQVDHDGGGGEELAV